MKLLIRNLSRTTTEAELQAMFEVHGTVQFCNLVIDNKTGESKGFGFIEMPKSGDAKVAMKILNGRDIVFHPFTIGTPELVLEWIEGLDEAYNHSELPTFSQIRCHSSDNS